MNSGVQLKIFRMPDGEEDFYQQYPFLEQCKDYVGSHYKAVSRRKEILSEKVLLKELFKDESVELMHDENGKPVLSNGKNISISHTRNHIAVMISESKEVALDIEHISERVKKVGRMYLREDENVSETNEMLVVWCAKETMYKLYSSQKLTFEEIRVRPFVIGKEGVMYADNLKTGETNELSYSVTDEYVITTACK